MDSFLDQIIISYADIYAVTWISDEYFRGNAARHTTLLIVPKVSSNLTGMLTLRRPPLPQVGIGKPPEYFSTSLVFLLSERGTASTES